MQDHYESIFLYNLHWNLLYFNSFHLYVSLNSYQHMIENICYAGNSNDEQFPDEISKNVDANDIKELRTLVEQTEQNKETSDL